MVLQEVGHEKNFQAILSRKIKLPLIMCLALIGILMFSTTVLASDTGDVAGAIEDTWSHALE